MNMSYTVKIVNALTESVLEIYRGFDTFNEADAKRIDLKNENYSKLDWLNFYIEEEVAS